MHYRAALLFALILTIACSSKPEFQQGSVMNWEGPENSENFSYHNVRWTKEYELKTYEFTTPSGKHVEDERHINNFKITGEIKNESDQPQPLVMIQFRVEGPEPCYPYESPLLPYDFRKPRDGEALQPGESHTFQLITVPRDMAYQERGILQINRVRIRLSDPQ